MNNKETLKDLEPIPDTSCLSPKTIGIVKATAHVVKDNINDITTRMYKLMFTNFPEVKDLFTSQTGHPGRAEEQARTLGKYIVAYARNIENLKNLKDDVERIVYKHLATEVYPQHYPVVGKCLIQAIKDVLNDAVTPEIETAWREAYDFLATLLMKCEEEMRREIESRPGGWRGVKWFVVDRKQQETTDVTSFYLRPENGDNIPSFHPGQFITFQLDIPGYPLQVHRNYSISNAPRQDLFRVSIKKMQTPSAHPDWKPGLVSNFFHNSVEAGTRLRVIAPVGQFKLPADKSIKNSNTPVVLLSAGVGATPLISMLESLANQGTNRQVWFIHGAKHGGEHLMKEHVKKTVSEYNRNFHLFVSYSHPRSDDIQGKDYNIHGRLSAKHVKELVHDHECNFFICGPEAFMKGMYNGLVNAEVSPERLHYEYFGPTQFLSS